MSKDSNKYCYCATVAGKNVVKRCIFLLWVLSQNEGERDVPYCGLLDGCELRLEPMTHIDNRGDVLRGDQCKKTHPRGVVLINIGAY